MFCKKCGSMMFAKTEKGKKVLVCRRCGYKTDKYEARSISTDVKHKPMDDVVVVEKEKSSLPVTDMKCSRCGNDKAYWWLKQMRSGDEPPTIFYRCTKCKHTWRKY